LELIIVDFNNKKGGDFNRHMFEGNWKCAECGTDITELPFEPREGSKVYCKDCYRKMKPSRRHFR
jgi:CxxC-x17-CxxC domain-containing protein